MSISATIRKRLNESGKRYFANDNIAAFMQPEDYESWIQEVENRVEDLLDALLIDTANDHNTKGTAQRIAKMYVQEVFRGRYDTPPAITSFPNHKNLDELYTTGPITVRSMCSHHFAPIMGKAWVGVVPGDRVIGLSKFNRIVDWFASRGQIQEELAIQIADYLEEKVQPRGLAVVIKATHTCMTMRGVRESHDAVMTTSVMRGAMRTKPEARAEFFSLIQ